MLIDEHKPDVIGGCESHLDNTYFTAEIFPPSYLVLRKTELKVLEESSFVTEFWKITHMGAPETIRIFEFSMALLIAEKTF